MRLDTEQKCFIKLSVAFIAGVLLRTLSAAVLGQYSFWEIPGEKFLPKLNNRFNLSPREINDIYSFGARIL